MTPPSAQARRERAAAEAIEWLQRLDCGDMSATERADFVDWLRESPIHVAEALRMERLSTELRQLNAWAGSAGQSDESANKIVPLRLNQSSGRAWMSRMRRLQMGAVAAGVVLVCTAVLRLGHPTRAQEFRTSIGERREITLDDGSVVRLSPNTDLQIEMKSNLRMLALRGGEAVFRVSKDPARPFIVNAARARVRAVGTIFAVTRNGDNVVVTVAEGQVTVAPVTPGGRQNSSDGPVPIALRENERISVSPVGTPGQVRHVEVNRLADWAEGQLVFENAPVAEVIGRFNRHNQLQIHVVDPKLNSLAVSGIFDADDPQSFIDFLTNFAGARITEHGPRDVVIMRRVESASPPVSDR